MGQHVSLTATDAHKLGGYRADPQGKPKGGIVASHVDVIRQLAPVIVASGT